MTPEEKDSLVKRLEKIGFLFSWDPLLTNISHGDDDSREEFGHIAMHFDNYRVYVKNTEANPLAKVLRAYNLKEVREGSRA